VPTIEPTASLLEPVELEDEPEDEVEAEVRITKEEDETAAAVDAGIGGRMGTVSTFIARSQAVAWVSPGS
jgi:hypothetical protein